MFTMTNFMKITDLLFNASEDSKSSVTKEYIMNRLKLIGTAQLKFIAFNSGEEMTIKYHNEIDKLISTGVLDNKGVNNKIQCDKGCSACCHSEVTITDLEAQVLRSFCKKNNLDLNTELMQKQVGKYGEDWLGLDWESRKCMFLNDQGACSVYEARPGVCRKHLVISDPVKCGVRGAVQVKDRIFNLEIELLVSAMWQIRKIGNMAEMINSVED